MRTWDAQGSLICSFLCALIPIILDLILAEEQTQSTNIPFSPGLLVGGSWWFRMQEAGEQRWVTQPGVTGLQVEALEGWPTSPGYSPYLVPCRDGTQPQEREPLRQRGPSSVVGHLKNLESQG